MKSETRVGSSKGNSISEEEMRETGSVSVCQVEEKIDNQFIVVVVVVVVVIAATATAANLMNLPKVFGRTNNETVYEMKYFHASPCQSYIYYLLIYVR